MLCTRMDVMSGGVNRGDQVSTHVPCVFGVLGGGGEGRGSSEGREKQERTSHPPGGKDWERGSWRLKSDKAEIVALPGPPSAGMALSHPIHPVPCHGCHAGGG